MALDLLGNEPAAGQTQRSDRGVQIGQFDARIDNVGIHRLTLPTSGLKPGVHFLRMTDGRDTGVQQVAVVR